MFHLYPLSVSLLISPRTASRQCVPGSPYIHALPRVYCGVSADIPEGDSRLSYVVHSVTSKQTHTQIMLYRGWILLLLLVIGQGMCQEDVEYKGTEKKAVSKFSIEQLMNTVYPHKISDDIDLDPCRSDGFMGDIALPNIEYEKQWKLQRLNRSYQDAFEKYKKEILLEGLQIEEEGLFDVQRRKVDYTQQGTVAEEEVATDDRDGVRGKGIKRSNGHRRGKKWASQRRERRAATAKNKRVWDYGVIPYEIDANFSGEHKALFKQAMRHWENSTCIKFVERDIQEHPDYIIFTERPCGCCSFVGKRGNGPQAISLGKNCDKFGIVVHELGHVVGFWHEHTRPDRDNHVQIVRENIMRGQEYNFNKLTEAEVNSLGLPYDYNSIMHYARNTFSKGTYLDTILPLVPTANKRLVIGQRIRLSEMDIAQTNLLYKCYKCGRTFQDNAGIFSSPVYPNVSESQEGEQCEWRISATHGQKIVLNITEIDISISEECSTDYVEVRDGYWHKSPVLGRFCGTGHNMSSIVSSGSRMIVTYITSSRQSGHRGFIANYEAVCGGDMYIVNNPGHLESPNYPEEYQNNNMCVWRLSVPDNLKVVLKFQSFELENHENCSNDYVEVRDGHSPNSPLIGRYCGFQMPDDIRSTESQLLVKFRTDSTLAMRGFSATIIQESDECTRKNHGCEHKCINTLGNYECACNIGYELHSDGKSCEQSCGGMYKNQNGTITSPSFPDVYPPNKKCVWEIRAPLHHKVMINFTHMDLDGDYYNCEYDTVVVHGYSEREKKEIEDFYIRRNHGTYCATRKPSLITSEGNILRVTFTSDDYIQKSGFAATFFMDRDECAVNNGGCEDECRNTIGSYQCICHDGFILDENKHDCKIGDCRFEITSPTRNVISPNYPKNYTSNNDCYWHFTCMPGHRVVVVFTDFDVEWHEQCHFDHVTFHNGDTSKSRTSGVFCGTEKPDAMVSSGNRMLMHFKSDSSIERKGFRATHTTVCGCHFQATNVSQYFFSHTKYGAYDYRNGADCDWIIEAPVGKLIRLTFETFELEDEPNCQFDFVEVLQYQFHSSGRSYGRFCGNTHPIQLYSDNEGLMIQFTSDNSIVSKGFKAAFLAVDEAEDFLITPTPPIEDMDYINGQ